MKMKPMTKTSKSETKFFKVLFTIFVSVFLCSSAQANSLSSLSGIGDATQAAVDSYLTKKIKSKRSGNSRNVASNETRRGERGEFIKTVNKKVYYVDPDPNCKEIRADWGEVIKKCRWTEQEYLAMQKAKTDKNCDTPRTGDETKDPNFVKVAIMGDGNINNGIEDQRSKCSTKTDKLCRASGTIWCEYDGKMWLGGSGFAVDSYYHWDETSKGYNKNRYVKLPKKPGKTRILFSGHGLLLRPDGDKNTFESVKLVDISKNCYYSPA
ncbi:MAG: hypothetical protein KDD40_04055, partial [Bdellovibrionales bacterium]|nr:hypothetical protein [Bdellovibrionales bacterium]